MRGGRLRRNMLKDMLWRALRFAFHDEGHLQLPLPAGTGVEHGVDHNSGYRHVEPDGKCKTGDFFVLRESSGQRKEESGEHHGQRHDAKKDMADQNGKVDCADRPLAEEMRVTVKRVVDDVADQEN